MMNKIVNVCFKNKKMIVKHIQFRKFRKHKVKIKNLQTKQNTNKKKTKIR